MASAAVAPAVAVPQTLAHEGQHFERRERRSADPKSSVKAHPKKEGAGGKFTFGKLGDEPGPSVLDAGDPNFDSEAEGEARCMRRNSKSGGEQEQKNAARRAPRAESFEAMAQHLYSGTAKSETSTYIWVILQGEACPRIVGTYSSYEKAHERLLAVVAAENERLQAGWTEAPLDTWCCGCDLVRIAKYPVDPQL
mmetsp:Transcript_112365/g.312667  ORF Transcript_112365/g.312667 Transcript_112365/m.312667 type:complete len:195 (-) Transcript_112365:96-680(-)|eukprot:CAMPEP_0179122970 /NCGR_PEP_ID=MMETSP0796-20121207/58057_1 /TAXON_ID=73915 /ORGANISM="Pyrodinium bahamense, Strain pbaha01" /LENGTH=194 /DNA_ID=CAMNT_0020821603 /DNA_START=90 /DNA_END=674 /DNA_ORIENTATION=+